MKCIFCKQDAADSKSVEHVIPESLGNKSFILPAGVVCDKCDNYFALKLEKVVLETNYFKNLRHRNGIESKKRKIPSGKTIMPITHFEAEVIPRINEPTEVILDKRSFALLQKGEIDHLILPFDFAYPKHDVIFSRFLAKVGLEMMALTILKKYREDQDLFATYDELDPIRNYARNNSNNDNWVYHSRKIYDEHEPFDLEGRIVDMLYESDFLCTGDGEIYFVIAFKGIEFTLNMAGSSLEGYEKWLVENNNISPLYSKINISRSRLKRMKK